MTKTTKDNYDEYDDDDYEEEDESDGLDDYEEDQEIEDDEHYDRLEQEPINDLVSDSAPNYDEKSIQNANSSDMDEQPDQIQRDEVTVTDTESPSAEAVTRRSIRDIIRPERLAYSNVQDIHERKVKFLDADFVRLESCLNFIAEVHPNPDLDCEYSQQTAMVIARVMNEINRKTTVEGKNLAQQHLKKV